MWTDYNHENFEVKQLLNKAEIKQREPFKLVLGPSDKNRISDKMARI